MPKLSGFERWRVCSKVWMGFLLPVVVLYVLAHFYRMLKTKGEKSPRVSITNKYIDKIKILLCRCSTCQV